MKKCTNCNSLYPEEKNFCKVCGSHLVLDSNFENNEMAIISTPISFSNYLNLFFKKHKWNLFSMLIGLVVYVSFFFSWLSSIDRWDHSAYDLVKNDFLIIFNHEYEHWILDLIFSVTLLILPFLGLNLIVQSIRQIFRINNVQTFSFVLSILSLTVIFLSKFEANFMLFFATTIFIWSILLILLEFKYGLKIHTLKSYINLNNGNVRKIDTIINIGKTWSHETISKTGRIRKALRVG